MAMVKDVVCGMMVDTETTELRSHFKGQTYYFCGPGCKREFDQDPEKFVEAEEADQGSTGQGASGAHA
jgi:Cu+-exporting ATPase